MTVTVDSTAHSADATWPSADGYIPANIVQADLYEPVTAPVTADTTAYTADASYPTADGYISGGGADVLDAVRIAAAGAGWVDRMSRPRRVVGVGYGVLPQLVGEGHGTVVLAGDGFAKLPISGAAAGQVDDELDELALTLMILLAA